MKVVVGNCRPEMRIAALQIRIRTGTWECRTERKCSWMVPVSLFRRATVIQMPTGHMDCSAPENEKREIRDYFFRDYI